MGNQAFGYEGNYGVKIYIKNSLKSGAFEFDGTENGDIELKSGAFESDVASNSKVATFE